MNFWMYQQARNVASAIIHAVSLNVVGALHALFLGQPGESVSNTRDAHEQESKHGVKEPPNHVLLRGS